MPDPTSLDIKVSTSGAPQAAADLQKFGAAAQSVEPATKRAAAGAKAAGDAFQDFGKKGSAAKDAFEGTAQLANGGATALFGFSKAWINVKEAFAANPITAVLGVTLGALTLVQKGFDVLVERATASRDAMFGTGQRTKELADSLVKLEAASKKALENMQSDTEKLLQTYSRLSAEVDKSTNRFKAEESARVKEELAKIEVERQTALGKSPQDAEAINDRFNKRGAAVRDASTKKLEDLDINTAKTKKGLATDEIKAIQLGVDTAGAAVTKADQEEAAAFEAYNNFRPTGDAAADAAAKTKLVDAGLKARAAAVKARANKETISKEATEKTLAAESKFKDADSTVNTLTAEQRARVQGDNAAVIAKKNEAEAALRSAAAKGEPTEALLRNVYKLWAEAAAFTKDAAAAQQSAAAAAARPNQGGTITRGGETKVVGDTEAVVSKVGASLKARDERINAALIEVFGDLDKQSERLRNAR